jgi:hypothetical protein
MNTTSNPAHSQPKVFGIGLNKTGTTTLGECGKILGLCCTSCDKGLLEDVASRNDFSRIIHKVNQHDLFEDWPWPLIYKQLDQMFPGSKFILTVRSSEGKWLESLKNHSMRTHPIGHCRRLAYGSTFLISMRKNIFSFIESTMKVSAHTLMAVAKTSWSCAGKTVTDGKSYAISWVVFILAFHFHMPTRARTFWLAKSES